MNRTSKIVITVGAVALGFWGLSAQISDADTPSEAPLAEQAPARAARTVANAASAMAQGREGEEYGTEAPANRRSPRAQAAPPDREYGRGEFAGLGISENQHTQIEAIKESEREQIAEMRATIHDSTRRARWNAIRAEAEALILEVLTPEQRRAREMAQARVRVARVNQQLERMNRRLSLSATQATRIRNILEQWDVDRDAGHRNDQDQEAALTRVREAAEAAMLNVLTPDQRVQLEQMWEERARRGR